MRSPVRRLGAAVDGALDSYGDNLAGLYVLGASLLWAGALLVLIVALAAPAAPVGTARHPLGSFIVIVVITGGVGLVSAFRDCGRRWPTYAATLAGLGWAPAVDGSPHSGTTLLTAAVGLASECAVIGLLRRRARLARRRTEVLQGRLLRLALTDPLTDLSNRRAFEEFLGGRLADEGSQSEMVLFALDVDNFKYVNDRLGHQAVDEVLVGPARLLARETGEHEMAARTGFPPASSRCFSACCCDRPRRGPILRRPPRPQPCESRRGRRRRDDGSVSQVHRSRLHERRRCFGVVLIRSPVEGGRARRQRRGRPERADARIPGSDQGRPRFRGSAAEAEGLEAVDLGKPGLRIGQVLDT